ncbi:MAG: hypothetical protein WCC41_19870 [Rhodomicrobium sp.]
MVSMFFIGLFIGLFYADRVRSLFRRMRNGLKKLFRSKPGDESVAALEPAEEPLAIKLRKLEKPISPRGRERVASARISGSALFSGGRSALQE